MDGDEIEIEIMRDESPKRDRTTAGTGGIRGWRGNQKPLLTQPPHPAFRNHNLRFDREKDNCFVSLVVRARTESYDRKYYKSSET